MKTYQFQSSSHFDSKSVFAQPTANRGACNLVPSRPLGERVTDHVVELIAKIPLRLRPAPSLPFTLDSASRPGDEG